MKEKLRKVIQIFNNNLVLMLILTIILYLYLLWLDSYLINPQNSKLVMMSFCVVTASITLLLPTIIAKIYSSIVIVIVSVYSYSQLIYFRAFEQYYRINTALSLTDEVQDQGAAITEFLKLEDLIILIIMVIAIVCIVLIRIPKLSLRQWPLSLIRGVIGIVLIIYGIGLYQNFYNEIIEETHNVDPFFYYKTEHYVFTTLNHPDRFVENYGIVALLVEDSKRVLFKSGISEQEVINIENYLSSREIETDNNYTGLFEGKELIIIQAESLANIVIDPVLTPTLYYLKETGMSFENFDAPLLPGSTSDAEIMANTGLIPALDGNITMMHYAINEFPTTLAGAFSNEGYTTFAFHNNFAEFYNRNVFMPHVGYDFFDSFRLGIESESYDHEMFNVAKWLLLETELSMSYFITYSGHQPYTELSEVFSENYAIVNETYPELDDSTNVYLAKSMDLDEVIRVYIDDLYFVGKKEDTVFVIFGDHYPKGIDHETNQEIMMDVYNVDTNFEAPLIIWTPNMEAEVVEKVCTPLDLMPTLLNLFNIDYDNQTIIGRDIFDPTYEGFLFNSSGTIVTDNFKFDGETQEVTLIDGYSKEKMEAEVENYRKIIQLSEYIFELNYFK